MKKNTSNALHILDRITGDDPRLRRLIQEEHHNLDVAGQIIALRSAWVSSAEARGPRDAAGGAP